jgi:hypothetical protein
LITLSDIGPVGGAIIFPDNIAISNLPSEDVPDLFSEYLNTGENVSASSKSSFRSSPFGPLILICGHASRDARCGEIAPLLVNEFEAVLRQRNLLYHPVSNPDGIRVGITSHIGGHAFAGNIVYYNGTPGSSGIWYGRVWPHHVQGIIEETVLNDTVIEELYRGETACARND